MKEQLFGKTADDKHIYLYTLENSNIKATVSNLGATLVSLLVRDKTGNWLDVVLGYDDVQQYLENTNTYFGGTVGRNANRIENALVAIEGINYRLPANEGENSLHSGPDGFQIRFWEVLKSNERQNGIEFELISPDKDQGFPGELKMTVIYELTDSGLTISFKGKSDQTTIFNPTNHSYFNLNGQGSGTILNHLLSLSADFYTPVKDSRGIPTGEKSLVAGTPLDFRVAAKIGQRINEPFEQLRLTGGYDHNFVLKKLGEGIEPFAKVIGDKSGIVMEVGTDLPCVQFYSGNFLQHEIGKNQAIYNERDGFCLETQFTPNGMNHGEERIPVIYPNHEITYRTTYNFSVSSDIF